MLLEFTCSNHESIKDKVTFSMLAGSDDFQEEFLREYGKYRVLRTAVIYGPNGSGKSKFIGAIEFVKMLVCASITHQPGQKIAQRPHRLSAIDDVSEYGIQFTKNDVRYSYGFTLKEGIVSEEYLYYFPNAKKVTLFERKGLEIIPGDKYKTAYAVSGTVLKENRLLLSCAANYSNIDEIVQAFMFFQEDIVIYNPVMNNWFQYSAELMERNPEIKQKFLEMLEKFGTGIKDFDVKINNIKLNDEEISQDMPVQLKMYVQQHEFVKIDTKLRYELFSTDLAVEESTGIKTLFEIICPIIDIVEKGKVLICDEFEKGLHESLVYNIVNAFKNADKKPFAQFIFSTHDTSLLKGDLFRRDQVWFTELTPERATDLYSLTEIKNVRKTENISKGYVSGRYGAVPMLSESLIDVFAKKKK